MGTQQIDILMLGGKRCGKTTVLASMIRNLHKVLAGTGMSLQTLGTDTQMQLDAAVRSIRNKLEDFNTPLTRVKVDENPTSAESGYYFLLTLSDQKQIGICIHDIPGEWLTDSVSHAARVKELVRDSKVIMIAIDTPYLFAKMTDEGYGVYHREYNKPLEIANFIKESFSEEDIRERMVLFVPLKCERYFHLTHSHELNIFNRNYMEEIVDAVGNGYHDLLVYLRNILSAAASVGSDDPMVLIQSQIEAQCRFRRQGTNQTLKAADQKKLDLRCRELFKDSAGSAHPVKCRESTE